MAVFDYGRAIGQGNRNALAQMQIQDYAQNQPNRNALAQIQLQQAKQDLINSRIPKTPTPTTAARDYKQAIAGGYKGSFFDYQKDLKSAGSTKINLGLSKGQEAVDKDYAKEFVDFQVSGGFADVDKQIKQLEQVRDQLASGAELTGPITGATPDPVLNVVNPQARAARDAVEEVVQRNLRLVLGAQFTEKEGERLIARAYNPSLSEEENLKRVNRLIDQIKQAAQAKKAAATYFKKKGTLKGFEGKQWTVEDFDVGGESNEVNWSDL